nr:hypothetical protein GCM10020093_115040 [Planobispora longispora]
MNWLKVAWTTGDARRAYRSRSLPARIRTAGGVVPVGGTFLLFNANVITFLNTGAAISPP